MMRDYAKVRPKFWTQGTGKRLRGNPNAQIVAAYLMSGPPGHMTGVFYCPLPTLSHETGIPLEGASKALADLAEEGFAFFDPAFDLMWVPNMAREQIGAALKPRDNLIQAICKHLGALGNHPFCLDFIHRYQGAYHLPPEMVGRALATPFEPPSREGPSNPLPTPFEARDQRSGIRDQRSGGGSDACAPAIPVPTGATRSRSHSTAPAPESEEGQPKATDLAGVNGSQKHTQPTAGLADDLDDPWDEPLPLKPCWRIWRIWEEVACGGVDKGGDRKPHERALIVTFGSLEKRAPNDPEGLWRRMAEAFVAQQRLIDRRVDLQWLLKDFAAWADFVERGGEPPRNVSRGTPNGGNGHHPNGSEVSLRADRKPIPPLPVKPREPESSEAPK